jgi:hypothetical protein
VATGRFSQAGRVEGEVPDKDRHIGPPGWGLGVGLTTPPRKKSIVTKPGRSRFFKDRGAIGYRYR